MQDRGSEEPQWIFSFLRSLLCHHHHLHEGARQGSLCHHPQHPGRAGPSRGWVNGSLNPDLLGAQLPSGLALSHSLSDLWCISPTLNATVIWFDLGQPHLPGQGQKDSLSLSSWEEEGDGQEELQYRGVRIPITSRPGSGPGAGAGGGEEEVGWAGRPCCTFEAQDLNSWKGCRCFPVLRDGQTSRR